MQVTLLHNTPLWVASKAIRKCWASEDKSDTMFNPNDPTDCLLGIGEKDKALIERVGNKNKHSSTLEHLNYSFDIDGISRACLQELARHRHASMSVKSTRYTLKELKDESHIYDIDNDYIGVNYDKYCVIVGQPSNLINIYNAKHLMYLQGLLQEGVSNDKIKYMLPEAYKTSLVWTVNARSLQNFLSLRTDKSALWEIRELAHKIFEELPEEHKYLFKEFVKERV